LWKEEVRSDTMAKELYYRSKASWTEKKKAKIKFENENKPTIEISVAPEFMGHKDIITPEDLFVSSVNSCMMSYFLNVAERMRIKFSLYESSATGTLQEKGIDFIFAKIDLDLKLDVEDEKSSRRAIRALEMAKEGCFVANSIKTEVNVNYDINIKGRER